MILLKNLETSQFFQYEAYLTAKVPRGHCDACGVHLIPVPWAREGSGFTLLFEVLVLSLAPAMPIKTLAKELNMHDTRLWRVVRHYTEQALKRRGLSQVRNVGFDETSSERRHDFAAETAPPVFRPFYLRKLSKDLEFQSIT